MRAKILVFGQFATIGVLLLGGGWALPWWGWVLFGLGIAVFLAAAMSLGSNNFTIMPDPRTGNSLSKRGIYAFLRHPMYTAVLLCGSAVAFGDPTVPRTVALVICVVVLVLKIRYEEEQLTRLHADYPVMMVGVKRLIPFVW